MTSNPRASSDRLAPPGELPISAKRARRGRQLRPAQGFFHFVPGPADHLGRRVEGRYSPRPASRDRPYTMKTDPPLNRLDQYAVGNPVARGSRPLKMIAPRKPLRMGARGPDRLVRGNGRRSDGWLKTVRARFGPVALPDMDLPHRPVTKQIPDSLGSGGPIFRRHFAQRKPPGPGKDRCEIEVGRKVLFFRQFECQKTRPGIGEAKIGPSQGHLGLDRLFRADLASGKNKMGRLR